MLPCYRENTMLMTKIYECSSAVICFLIALTLTRYVFLIPALQKRVHDVLYHVGSLLAIAAVSFFFGKMPGIILTGMLLGIYIFLTGTHDKKGYFGTLLLFPILGLTLGILTPLIEIPSLFLKMSTEVFEIFSMVVYGILLVSYALVRIIHRKRLGGFLHDIRKRRLGQWETILLCVIGVMVLLVIPIISVYDSVTTGSLRNQEFIQMRGINSMICFVVTVTACILALRSSQNAFLRSQIMQMQHNLINTMADIIENRDENTGYHTRRTAKYVEIIAIALKFEHVYSNILTDEYISDMIIAAPLHDIGKIHIPDTVLKKEGRYTEEEFQIMKSHTTAGKRLLLQAEKTLGYSSYLSVAVQMAGYHHEWWNGRGYPEGRKGQDIPLCARIMAVADVFDSLVSARCYKGAMSMEQAFALIERESGTHFEPAIVEAFLDAKAEIAQVANEFKEQPVVLTHEEKDEKPMAGSKTPIRPELEAAADAAPERASESCNTAP